ncbi:transporter substrate-binding domain-containing protein [Agrobacterium burrii]
MTTRTRSTSKRLRAALISFSFAFPLITGPVSAQDAGVKAVRALLPQKYQDAGILNVAASTTYAPHSYYKEGTTDFRGYEIQLFNEIALILGVKPVYTEAPFQQLIAGIKSGRSDLSLGNLGDNNLRREQVDFIDHSRMTFQLVIGQVDKDSIKSVFDLCGRDIGVVQGTTTIISKTLSRCESKGLKPVHYVEFPDSAAKDQAIQSRRLPRADIASTSIARYREDAGLTPGQLLVPTPEVGDLYIGFIVNKGNTDLANAVAAALKILVDNGRYAEILAAYNIPDLKLETTGVNIGEKASNWLQVKS